MTDLTNKFFTVTFETDSTLSAEALKTTLRDLIDMPELSLEHNYWQRNAVVEVKEAIELPHPGVMGSEILRDFFTGGKLIRLTGWPTGDHIEADGAEGGTIWYYSAENDELTPDYRLGFHELCGTWEVLP